MVIEEQTETKRASGEVENIVIRSTEKMEIEIPNSHSNDPEEAVRGQDNANPEILMASNVESEAR